MGVLVDDGSVLLSADGGSSWRPAAALPQSRGRLSAISFSPLDAKTIYVASRAPVKNARHLWISRDGGQHWRAIDRGNFPVGAPVNVVVGDPRRRGTLYAGTHLGLYLSRDYGEHWDRFGARLPLVGVTDIDVSPGAGLFRIATFGRGIWELRPVARPAPMPPLSLSPSLMLITP